MQERGNVGLQSISRRLRCGKRGALAAIPPSGKMWQGQSSPKRSADESMTDEWWWWGGGYDVSKGHGYVQKRAREGGMGVGEERLWRDENLENLVWRRSWSCVFTLFSPWKAPRSSKSSISTPFFLSFSEKQKLKLRVKKRVPPAAFPRSFVWRVCVVFDCVCVVAWWRTWIAA